MLPVGNVSHNEAIDRFNRSFILMAWLGNSRLGVPREGKRKIMSRSNFFCQSNLKLIGLIKFILENIYR